MPAVPWNAGWTAEERFEVRPCRWADGRLALWQPHAPGEGRPIFAKPHSVRQRRSIAEMRCTVCGQLTPVDDRYWFGLGETRDRHWMTSEAPVHQLCARLAFEICPHLHARGVPPEPMPTGYTVMMTQIAGKAVEQDFGIVLQRPWIIGSLKLAWPAARVRFR